MLFFYTNNRLIANNGTVYSRLNRSGDEVRALTTPPLNYKKRAIIYINRAAA